MSSSKKRPKGSKSPSMSTYPQGLFKAFSKVFSNVDSELSRRAASLVEMGDFKGYLELTIDPKAYTTAEDFFVDYQAVKFFAKCEDLPLTIDRVSSALEKWYAAEESCKLANDRIRNISVNPFEGSANEILHLARCKIRSILGDLNVSEWLDSCGWGPGATSSVSGRDCSSQRKFRARADVTSDLLPYVEFIKNEFPLWDVKDVTKRDYGKLTFVPKTAKVDRAICVEPHLNTFFQKGLGSVIRKRLKQVDIDLDHGQALHRYYAARLSKYKEGSTVDLSSASDTIAKALVAHLFPTDWLHALTITRTPIVELPDGQKWLLEKFSAMGNGYTFELETLIFYSLIQAISMYYGIDSTSLVYGDDIIVPDELAAKIEYWFPVFGFDLNRDKTFHGDSPFRESCGMDCFEGIPVRPFFLKSLPKNEQDLFKLSNGVREVAAQHARAVQFNFPFSLAGKRGLLRYTNPPRVRSRVLDLMAESELPELERACSSLLRPLYDSIVDLIPPMRRNFVSFPCTTVSGLIGNADEVPTLEHHQVGTPHSKKIELVTDINGVHFVDTDQCYIAYETRHSSVDERDLTSVSLRRGVTYRYRRKMRPHKWFIFGSWT